MRHDHLYVILDIFSRYVVGWMLAQRESAELAEQFIAETLQKEHIAPGTPTLHADRGTSMRSKPVAALLIDMDVAKTHSPRELPTAAWLNPPKTRRHHPHSRPRAL